MAPRRKAKKLSVQEGGASEEGDDKGGNSRGGYLSVYKGAYVYESERTDEKIGPIAGDVDDDDDEVEIIQNEIDEQEPVEDEIVDEDEVVVVPMMGRVRHSIGSTKDQVRFALETSKNYIQDTPQRIRNWRRLSITQNDGRPRVPGGMSDSVTRAYRKFMSDRKNLHILVLGLFVAVTLLMSVTVFPYLRKNVDPATVSVRIARSKATFQQPFIRLGTGIGSAISTIGITGNVSRFVEGFSGSMQPLVSKLRNPELHIRLPSIALPNINLGSVSDSQLISKFRNAVTAAGESVAVVAGSIVSYGNSLVASFLDAKNWLLSYVSKIRLPNFAANIDRTRFISRDEFSQVIDDLKSASTDDIEQQIRRFISEEKEKIRDSVSDRKQKVARLREEVIADLKERSTRAASALETVKAKLFSVSGDIQLKQRNVLRDVKLSVTEAYDLPSDKIEQAVRDSETSVDEVAASLTESADILKEKAAQIVAAEESEITREMEKLKSSISESGDSTIDEFVTRKQRTVDGLKRTKYTVDRIVNNWNARQLARVAEIKASLVKTLQRSGVRPRYMTRGELDKLVKELKETISLDEVEDQIVRTVRAEVQKVNAKLLSKRKLTREEVTMEVLERVVADKGGRPDFALQSAGAYVLSASPSYLNQYVTAIKDRFLLLLGQFDSDYVLGFPNSPSTAISPDISLGNCWGFLGRESNLTVHLSRPVIVDAFTVEHAPRAAVFSLSSAPRVVRVYGIPATSTRVSEREKEFFFGELEYSIAEEEYHMQYYEVAEEFRVQEPVRAVRIQIVDNHGGDFTCLYRIRVHGLDV